MKLFAFCRYLTVNLNSACEDGWEEHAFGDVNLCWKNFGFQKPFSQAVASCESAGAELPLPTSLGY